ncbi:hypothetical protein EMCRGX_G014629 [Ephydatia muelleri]
MPSTAGNMTIPVGTIVSARLAFGFSTPKSHRLNDSAKEAYVDDSKQDEVGDDNVCNEVKSRCAKAAASKQEVIEGSGKVSTLSRTPLQRSYDTLALASLRANMTVIGLMATPKIQLKSVRSMQRNTPGLLDRRVLAVTLLSGYHYTPWGVIPKQAYEHP